MQATQHCSQNIFWYSISFNILLCIVLIGCSEQLVTDNKSQEHTNPLPTMKAKTNTPEHIILLPTIPLPQMPVVFVTEVPAHTSRRMKPVFPTPAAVVTGHTTYLSAALKYGQDYKYSCEFDAGWVILQSYGINVTVDELIAKLPLDNSIEPYIGETPDSFVIYGGDILNGYSGNYKTNFLARSTGKAFAKVFAAYGLKTQPVNTRTQIETALQRGNLVWIKTTVDFQSGRPANWITPQDKHIKTVLGNDHAVVVIGYNDLVVIIRDVLGPTSSNSHRNFEYEVPWEQFLDAWGMQDFDGIEVLRPMEN